MHTKVTGKKKTALHSQIILQNETGEGSIDVYRFSELFMVSIIDLTMETCPLLDDPTAPMRDLIMVNYCETGCCESALPSQSSYFVKTGDCCLNTSFDPAVTQRFPLGIYRGIELFIHPDILQNPCFAPLANTGLSLPSWVESLQSGPVSFYRDENLREIFKRMRSAVLEEDSFLAGLKLMEFMYHIDCIGIRQRPTVTYYSRAQIAIAREVHDLLLSSPRASFHLADLSVRYHISPSTLNKYFYAVYGEYIPTFHYNIRMKEAAWLLQSTDHPIADIAQMVGYENPSKFSQAFRRKYMDTPSEYRKQHLGAGR